MRKNEEIGGREGGREGGQNARKEAKIEEGRVRKSKGGNVRYAFLRVIWS